jgi:hypothetical protein
LEASCRFKKKEIEQVLETLLRSKELVVERAEIVSQALRKFSVSRADFTDCADRALWPRGGMQTHHHLRPECRDRCWHAPAGLICLLVRRND